MITTFLAFCAFTGGVQEDPSKELRAWIEKLRSERIEERDRAMEEIKKLGKAAVADLEKVAGDKDLEVASRARALIRAARLKEHFGVDPKDLDHLPALTLIGWMEKKSGRKFLFTADLGLHNVRLRVPEELMDSADLYSLGVDLLRLANIGVAPAGSAPGAMELFPASLGSKKGLKACKSVEELPEANEFCTLVLHPRHLSPRDAQAMLINIMSFPQNCLSEEQTGSLVLSDYASVLRKCAGIVAGLDVSRSFRVSVVLLEGRTGKDASVPEPYQDLRLREATGLNRFSVLGTASSKLERIVQMDRVAPRPGAGAGGVRNMLRFPGPPPLVLDYDATVRAVGGPSFQRFTLRLDQDRSPILFEAQFSLKDGQWTFLGSVPTADGASLVILARALAD